MPSKIQKSRDAIMAVSIGVFSNDAVYASEPSEHDLEQGGAAIVHEGAEPADSEQSEHDIDFSFLQFVVPDSELDDRNCSLLSKHFQATYCLPQELDTDFTDVGHRYTFPHNNKLDQPRFKAFDCGDLQFNRPNSDSVADKPTEAWRCLGNFNIMSGESWSVKGAASVRQDTTDIPNSKRFGVCPEGDANCLGWGIQVEIKFDP